MSGLGKLEVTQPISKYALPERRCILITNLSNMYAAQEVASTIAVKMKQANKSPRDGSLTDVWLWLNQVLY